MEGTDLTGNCYFGAETWISYGRFAGLLSGSVVSSQVRRAPRGSCCSRPVLPHCATAAATLGPCVLCDAVCVPRMGYMAAELRIHSSRMSTSPWWEAGTLARWADGEISPESRQSRQARQARQASELAGDDQARQGDVMQHHDRPQALIMPTPETNTTGSFSRCVVGRVLQCPCHLVSVRVYLHAPRAMHRPWRVRLIFLNPKRSSGNR